MDSIGGRNFIFYTPLQIWNWLRENSAKSMHKHFKEFEIGLLLTQFMLPKGQWSAGPRLLEIHKVISPDHNYTLDELFAKEHLIDDSDADIFIQNTERKTVHPIQITRLTGHFKKDGCQERLLKLLSKKLLVQPDPLMVLVVNIEVGAILSLSTIHEYLASQKIPYGGVYLVGKNTQVLHQYSWTEIWPEVVRGTTINLSDMFQ